MPLKQSTLSFGGSSKPSEAKPKQTIMSMFNKMSSSSSPATSKSDSEEKVPVKEEVIASSSEAETKKEVPTIAPSTATKKGVTPTKRSATDSADSSRRKKKQVLDDSDLDSDGDDDEATPMDTEEVVESAEEKMDAQEMDQQEDGEGEEAAPEDEKMGSADAVVEEAETSTSSIAADDSQVEDAENKVKSEESRSKASAQWALGTAADDESATLISKMVTTTGNGGGKSDLVSQTTLSYDPTEGMPWKNGQETPFLHLARTLSAMSEVSGRYATIELLSNCFRSIIALTPDDLVPAVYLARHRVAPDYKGIELGVGDSILLKAIAESTGRSMQKLKEDYDRIGDLGTVAQNSRNMQRTLFKPKALTVQKVFQNLYTLATESGKSSQQKKKDILKYLLSASRDVESRYIVRLVQGNLRSNVGSKTVLTALAHAIVLSKIPTAKLQKAKAGTPFMEDLVKQLTAAADKVKVAYSELPVFEKIIEALLKYDIDELNEHCTLTPGIPVSPMLAKPTKSISEVLDRIQGCRFTCEFKYDGERAQIHVMDSGKTVKIFSRNAEDTTGKFPDVIANLQSVLGDTTESCILDAEVVAYNPAENKILPFQVLTTRSRKDVAIADIKVQVCLFAFDILYYNGKSMMKSTLEERREVLHNSCKEVEGKFMFATQKVLSDIDDIQTFLNEAVDGNCEGLMVKTLDVNATYEPEKRSLNWLKLKKDYVAGTGDTFDLVVIGAYHGKGKRAGWYGGFLLACYNEDNDTYESCCKCSTGFSEQDLQEYTTWVNEHKIAEKKAYYHLGDNLTPDVYVDPLIVWEINAADLQLSPVHHAAMGMVHNSRGIGLRFPRFMRERDDKTPEHATSAEQIADMYRGQKINQPSHGQFMGDDDF